MRETARRDEGDRTTKNEAQPAVSIPGTRATAIPKRLAVLVPGRLSTRTGGYEYDRRMIAGFRARGWDVQVRELDASFPYPTDAALRHAAGVLQEIPDRSPVLV